MLKNASSTLDKKPLTWDGGNFRDCNAVNKKSIDRPAAHVVILVRSDGLLNDTHRSLTSAVHSYRHYQMTVESILLWLKLIGAQENTFHLSHAVRVTVNH